MKWVWLSALILVAQASRYEYVVTGIIMVLSVWIAFRAAGKIFRTGVLMTGKPPKFKEILGWLRAN